MPIDESVIGPPLLETLQLLSGSTEAATTERLAAAFKASYDSTGLLETRAYEGVGEMLAGLAARGRTLHIATNKRIHPTRLILRHLGWAGLFENVYALDLFEPRLKDKAAMIRRLLEDRQIPLGDALYIGDREEDGSSAEANALPFIAATWGYGALTAAELRPDWRMAKNPRPSRRCSEPARRLLPCRQPASAEAWPAARPLRRCRDRHPMCVAPAPVPGADCSRMAPAQRLRPAPTWRRARALAHSRARFRQAALSKHVAPAQSGARAVAFERGPRHAAFPGCSPASSRLVCMGLRKCFRTYHQQMIFVRAIRPQGSAPEGEGHHLAANPCTAIVCPKKHSRKPFGHEKARQAPRSKVFPAYSVNHPNGCNINAQADRQIFSGAAAVGN